MTTQSAAQCSEVGQRPAPARPGPGRGKTERICLSFPSRLFVTSDNDSASLEHEDVATGRELEPHACALDPAPPGRPWWLQQVGPRGCRPGLRPQWGLPFPALDRLFPHLAPSRCTHPPNAALAPLPAASQPRPAWGDGTQSLRSLVLVCTRLGSRKELKPAASSLWQPPEVGLFFPSCKSGSKSPSGATVIRVPSLRNAITEVQTDIILTPGAELWHCGGCRLSGGQEVAPAAGTGPGGILCCPSPLTPLPPRPGRQREAGWPQALSSSSASVSLIPSFAD